MPGIGVERPDREDWPVKPMQHAHPGQARLADLCRADEIEPAARVLPLRALRFFGDPQPASARAEQVACTPAMAAEVARQIGVVDDGCGGQMRVGGAHPLHRRPQRACVGRSVRPAGEVRSPIHERQRGAKVEADQRVPTASRA